MKKKLFIFMISLVLVVFNLSYNPLSARNSSRRVANLLSLSNLVIYDCNYPAGSCVSKKIMTIEQISVEPGKNYTLVVDQMFYREQAWDDGRCTFSDVVFYFFDENNPQLGVTESSPFNATSTYFYVTFEASYSSLLIKDIPIDAHESALRSNKIMLFEGTIADFEQYVNYNSPKNSSKGVFLVDYDNKKTVAEIMNYISAEDDIDGDITNKIVLVEDNYTPQMHVLGNHLVTFAISDEGNNRVYYDLTVKLVDITPPVIVGPNSYNLELNVETITLNEIKRSLQISDNYDLLDEKDLIVLYDTYSANKYLAGEYTIRFLLKDSSENQTTFNVAIKVEDTTPPEITGPAEIYRYTSDPHLMMADIISFYEALDLVDGDITDQLELSGTYENTVPGTYEILIKSTDSSGNIATKALQIHVVDGIPPVFITDEFIISFSALESMTTEDIISWLEQHITEGSNFKILLNESLYKRNNKDEMYLYYSYDFNDKLCYGRVLIKPDLKTNIVPSIIGGLLILFNGLFLVVYFKRVRYSV
ncbi:MAG: DUF5011 domain-containing protein [Acholeplasmataceae bacterium]|nr:DUF5011 domain-containing protein [Acholeplasmataceae bacterium]